MVNITYLDIQRLSTEDGPGLRTTVFFKGCPLACAWCHNPESIKFEPEIICVEERCMGCSLCEAACPQNGRQKSVTNRTLCTACGNCVEACPAAAIELKGTTAPASDIAYELLKDRAYWGSDGGVTLSGGEAAMQADGALELLRLLKAEGIHTILDTCGLVPWDILSRFMPLTDLFLYDIKLAGSEQHKQWTRADNKMILSNARQLHDCDAKMWIRTPIIPGATDSEDNIREIGTFIAEYLPNTERWELCSFNNLCRDKYKRLGIDFKFAEAALMERKDMEKLRDAAVQHFSKTIWTGAVKL